MCFKDEIHLFKKITLKKFLKENKPLFMNDNKPFGIGVEAPMEMCRPEINKKDPWMFLY